MLNEAPVLAFSFLDQTGSNIVHQAEQTFLDDIVGGKPILKHKLKNKRFFVLTVAVAAVLLMAGSFYAGYKKGGGTSDAIATLPPELRSASVIEASFQALPPAPPAPGAIRVPIFIYHSVRLYSQSETAIQDAYDITPELLEKQLAYLKDNGYSVITLDQLAADLKAGTTAPVVKPVVLTFDDGNESQYTAAFPLLKKYHDTAAFYIYTNAIGKKYFLSWDQVKEMDAAGMTIADHTLSHPDIRGLSLNQIKKEVTDSKKIIEEHLGKPVVHFASPFGYSDADIRLIIKAAGYKTARTTYRGAYQNNPFRLTGFLVSDNFNDFVSALTQ